ncbi:period circadian protein homolog 2-like isoform X2 [Brienomyrus brachyistius]|uniref:period circadian protein homolog 2-like isoform X2 n=1 Tax=Brienomyrus brachyistius TaxID=42636 RepID=UPI0020B32252|nr:period circadian protein homolog 2-like isoform X2 [Brienomyrus brachyistius]
MSEDSEPKGYLYSALEGQDGGSHHPFGEGSTAGRGSMGQLHLMSGFAEGRGRGRAGSELGLASEGSDSSSQDRSASPHGDRKRTRSLHEDVEMKSSGSSGSGTESHGNESHGNESHGNESHGNESHGNESLGSSNGNSKDSALLESSGSNKSSNSHSPSPPSSSNAFSLLSASSEQDNPSTSGCSSEESAKAKTQKELIKTLKELKLHLPSEKRNKRSTSSTLNTLKYALHCVKQVKANEEYYQMLMINDSHPLGLDVSSYTIEEIDSITSEYTLKNTDIFAVTVSLITGKIVYISDQAASILNCKRDVFKNSKFVEFLSPQDVSVFYSFTTPYRLPSWSVCTGAESSPSDCLQEKSFFCRISGGREHEGDLQYFPFRMTPYLMKVQDMERAEDQFCCLLLAERVHSGYEAPRIPTDKRIFTTTHSTNCVFQDVDERAVPLLGYLPQDLIGTPVLLHLHPSDRPIMLGVHRKILQLGGQPFDHSSIRFCARNGEYVTLDTSWSSFVNPWSRKVSFIIGRHKVRMGPVNEDVFTPPPFAEGKTMDPDILEITEHIHRLLLQPIHSCSSGSYGEHLLNVERVSGESSSRGRPEEVEAEQAKPRTFQEICKDIHSQKNPQQQIVTSISAKVEAKRSPGGTQQKSPAVRSKAGTLSWKEDLVGLEDRPPRLDELSYKDQTIYSYQQLSCLDSVIRYLDSCNIPVTVKRKCQSSSNTTSSNSDEDRQKLPSNPLPGSKDVALIEADGQLSTIKEPKKADSGAVVGSSLAPLALPSKPESVVSITSQCSYSSTIVHVGDKKPQPDSEIIEDVTGSGEATEGLASVPPPNAVSSPSQEREPYKKLGLTKQVLAAHTQKEEQTFLCRIRELRGVRSFQADCSRYLDRQRCANGGPAPVVKKQGVADTEATPRAGGAAVPRKGGRNKKTKWKRAKKQESSDSTASHGQQPPRAPLASLQQTSWSTSDTSQSTFPMAYPAVMPAYPLQLFSGPRADPAVSGLGESQCSQDPRCPVPPSPYTAPMVTPVVALVLPNYVFPQIGGALRQPFYSEAASFPLQATFPPQPQFPPQAAFPAPPTFPPQPQFPPQAAFPAPPTFPPQPQFHPQAAFPAPPTFPPQPQFPPQAAFPAPPTFPPQPQFPPQGTFPAPAFQYGAPAESPKAPVAGPRDAASRSSTPQSTRDQASPPLFQSRCSSPLQLNLLQLEESQRSLEHQEGAAPSGGTQGNNVAERGSSSPKADKELQPMSPTCEGHLSDGHSSSSDLLDILLQEDSCSGTGSATSGSLVSGSNGCGTSASGRGSSHTSNNSSKYFGSVDSSQTSQQGATVHNNEVEDPAGGARFKCVLQDPHWLLMANVGQAMMMTYQLPSRDTEKVLRQDREKLQRMQKSQLRFTEDQKKELMEVHPWMKKGRLPKAIDVQACMCCEEIGSALIEEEPPDLDLGDTSDGPTQKGNEGTPLASASPLAT